MRGMNAKTGKELSGFDHLKQSIRDILTTPIGSRIMLREYGSRLFDLIDSPINQNTIMEVDSATVEALPPWEPRLDVISVFPEFVETERLVLGLNGKCSKTEEAISIGGLVISR